MPGRLRLLATIPTLFLVGCAESGTPCEDECDLAHSSRCAGSIVQVCEEMANGCLHWETVTDCASQGQGCDPVRGACDGSCTDWCSTVGEPRCQGTAIQTCQVATDGCLDWVETTDCADQGRFCEPVGVTCVDQCTDQCTPSGNTRCDGTVIQTCQEGAGGCLYWTDGIDCADTEQTCDDQIGDAACVAGCTSPPAIPSMPNPSHGAVDVDTVATTQVDWADAFGASSYAVYLSTSCPPPTYPNASFTPVTASELSGLTLATGSSYCWQVVAIDTPDCFRLGPVWTFDTAGVCNDPVAGPPTVTSSLASSYPAGTTSDVYTLTFSEAVTGVSTHTTWTPVVGTGTMVVSTVDPQTYLVNFSGAADGDQYTLTVGTSVTDTCGNALGATVNIDITIETAGQPGTTCAEAVDVSSVSFPHQVTGTFADDPTQHGSCDISPTNAVWFEYTPADTGWYDIDLQNHTTNSSTYSRLAVFEGDSCAPLGTELGCEQASSRSISTLVEMSAGTPYLILFHTDGDSYPMEDPEITITARTTSEGEYCAEAVDVSSVSFPHQLTGNFADDPTEHGSCDISPTNAVWFEYTPTDTGWYDLDLQNHTTNSSAYSRLAVFEGDSCAPLGTEKACQTASSRTLSTLAEMSAGTPYLILFHTDGDSYPMVDPEISIAPLTTGPGEYCDDPADVGQSFPFQLTGTFHDDPDENGSCDISPTNAVWFTYTPPETGYYDVTAQNHTTQTSAYSRLAVFDGTGCAPLGTELACQTASSRTLSTLALLTQSQPVLILFHTDSNTYRMENPEITLDAETDDPGEFCTDAHDVTGATFPVQLTGTYHDDPATGGSCDSSPTNAVWFTYSPATTGSYTIEAQNFTSQTSAYSRLAIFEGTSCGSYGTQVVCQTASSRTVSTTQTLDAAITYLILFHTDGPSYRMENPEIDIY